MTSRLAALVFDAHDPVVLGGFWAGVLGLELVDDPDGGTALLLNDDTGFRIEFFPTEDQKSGPNQIHFDLTSIPRGTGADRRAGARARRPAHRRRSAAGGGARRARRSRGQRVLRHRGRATTSWPTAAPSGPCRATARRRSATSGARRSAGRWSGTRTRRPRSGRRTADRRSRGEARPSRRRRGRTGCTSTSPHLQTKINRPRSNVSSPSVRSASTSGRATSAG